MIAGFAVILSVLVYQLFTGLIQGCDNQKPLRFTDDEYHWYRNGQGFGLVATAVSSLLWHPAWWIGLIVIALAWVGGDGGYNRVLWRKASGNWRDSGVLPCQRKYWWTWFHPGTVADWWRFGVCVAAAVGIVLAHGVRLL